MQIIIASAFVLFLACLHVCAEGPPAYNFEKFSFRKKTKHGRAVRTALRLCDEACFALKLDSELETTNCARKCVSPSCLDKLYGSDPLEPGEIDVRSTSFKGCVQQAFKSAGVTNFNINDVLNLPQAPEEVPA